MSPLKTVCRDLKSKPLAVVGEGSHGKSSCVKWVVEWALENNYVVKAFDISMAWWYNVPLLEKQTCLDVNSVENRDNCVYDMSLMSYEERRLLIARIIYEDWLNQRDGVFLDREFIDKNKRILMIWDEGSSYLDSRSLNRSDFPGNTLRDYLATGRNYGQDGIIIARAISGEIATKYRRKCNYLLGKIMGDEEVSYLRRGTDRAFIETAKTLPRYSFIYYGSERIDQPFSFPYREDYDDPVDVSPKPVEPASKKSEKLTKKQEWDILSRVLKW